ncbi:NAD-dependent epimerase/dehydratase family protein, partial [Streptomyces sp. NPDC057638]|uniref:NAD-dependent epimerase/dehydratase family protein n=1 Tax=Streptomyces sp. NPDC057638 TaxID=3346190 RepID=UPI0036911362
MSGLTVVLTGATGFIGSAVLRELRRRRARHGLVIHTVGRRPPARPRAGERWTRADLAEPGTLAGVCAGADVLLHLASLIGPDEERCAAVNTAGSAALMAQATRAGVGRIVHLSTAAVYGEGPHRGIAVGEVQPAPLSPASRTRLA